jgi:hypothetical protein
VDEAGTPSLRPARVDNHRAAPTLWMNLDFREHTMAEVFTQASVSLDGYIAGPGNAGFKHRRRPADSGPLHRPLGSRSRPPPKPSTTPAALSW